MKLYISADIEGISGVVNWGFTVGDGLEYNRGRKLMTDEVNAAVRGAKMAGFNDIIINDSHGPMTNILIEELDEDVMLISGNKKHLGMMEGIDETFDAAIFIGYHGRNNSPGVLTHSYHGRVISEVKINECVLGEFEFNSLVAGYYNVPVAFVSGDNIVTTQVKAWNEDIEVLTVKYANSRYAAKCIQPKKVHKMLEEGVYGVLKGDFKTIEPSKAAEPIELQIAFMNSGMAEAALLIPEVEMVSPNRIKYNATNIVDAYKMRTACTLLAANWM